MASFFTLFRRALTCTFALFLLLGAAGAVLAAEEGKVITTDALKGMIDAKRVFTLIDARTPDEFKEAHIVNAVNIQEKDFRAALPSLPKNKDAELVVYCNGIKCGKSKEVANKARRAGYRNVLVYSEGFPVWEEKGMPIVTGPNYGQKVKTVRVAAKDVAALLKEKQGEYVVVDVREPKEYANGHIPGAVNIPVGTLAANSGNLPKDKGLVVYCQSGKRSNTAIRKLLGLGYTSILETTWVDWKDAELPISK